MSSLDNLFTKEFLQTMKARASAKPLDLYKIGVPNLTDTGNRVAKADQVLTRGISDPYYKALNNSESILWSRPNLKKRKYGANGKFLLDAKGKVITEDITLPRNCVAIVSKIKLGVPTKHTPKEDFMYVDYLVDRLSQDISYVYIVPKKYCYKLNQTALVLSTKALRSHYEGMSVYLQSGHAIYIYIVPFKPTHAQRPYRPLLTKTSIDYNREINVLLNTWVRHNVVFNRKLTELSEPVRDRNNVAYKVFGSVLDDYVRFDSDKTLADIQNDASDVMH